MTSLRLLLLPPLWLLLAAVPAAAQGIDLGINVAGAAVGVQLGGASGPVGVDIGVGEVSVGAGVSVGSGAGSESAQPQRLGQEGALEAVRSHRALPLEDILERARGITDEEIIDAQLIGVRGILLYQLKLLGKTGDVNQLYFYARSGLPVQGN